MSEAGAASISAIVVSYHTGPLLGRCLTALRGERDISEIILVNNGNPSGAVEKAIRESDVGVIAPPVRVISDHGNVGFAAACNLGARAARSPLLLFINPDAVLPPEGAARLREDSASLLQPWMIGAKLISPDGKEQRGARRTELTPWRAIVEAGRLYKLAPNAPMFQRFNLHEAPPPDDLVEMPTISGACFFLSADDYWRINGMDERYFLHVEDIDFCHRFRRAGGRVFYSPHVEVIHRQGSSRTGAAQVSAWKTRSKILFFKNHYSERYPKWTLAIISFLLWGVHYGKAALNSVRGGFRIVRFSLRNGVQGLRRAQMMRPKRQGR
ncbi:MAG: glycosyltransferase family 2 protein [Pseudomonadota bacterium]